MRFFIEEEMTVQEYMDVWDILGVCPEKLISRKEVRILYQTSMYDVSLSLSDNDMREIIGNEYIYLPDVGFRENMENRAHLLHIGLERFKDLSEIKLYWRLTKEQLLLIERARTAYLLGTTRIKHREVGARAIGFIIMTMMYRWEMLDMPPLSDEYLREKWVSLEPEDRPSKVQFGRNYDVGRSEIYRILKGL